jgi:DNA segregation ATPase FtsK/SpoIIIE-like protein
VTQKALIQFVATTVVLVFAIGIILSGDQVQSSWLGYYSYAVTAATIALALWNKWIWRWKWAQKLPHVPRSIRGTWRGTLASAWINPDTGQSPPPKPVFLVVRQSATTISAVLLTDESSSRSTMANLAEDEIGAALSYIYLNRPKVKVEHRSRMHNGSAFLEVSGRPANRLHGRYWTDRDTRGEFNFDQRRAAIADDFEEAAGLFQP